MPLIDLAHTSQYGPNNPGSVGTGFTTGPNASPMTNMQLGNPIKSGVAYDSLEAAANKSLLGPNNPIGSPSAGFIPDPFANKPSELPF
jgi:hypothetical protein